MDDNDDVLCQPEDLEAANVTETSVELRWQQGSCSKGVLLEVQDVDEVRKETCWESLLCMAMIFISL